MKIALQLVGAGCAGKTFYAELLRARLNAPIKRLDCLRDENHDWMLKPYEDLVIIDGNDTELVKEQLKDHKIISILIAPTYYKWIENVEKRKKEYPDCEATIVSHEVYDEHIESWRKKLKRFIEVTDYKDLDIVTMEQFRNLGYQHEGLTDVKWKQLKIDAKGKSLLDLGCSGCWYEKFAKAKEYVGLDSNFAYLINPNAYNFDLNHLEDCNIYSDIVVSTSVMHYIPDKEKFIKECARLTKELCVLELPFHKGKTMKQETLHGYPCPSVRLFESWLKKYFKSFECIGESVVENDSWRLIYHCKK